MHGHLSKKNNLHCGHLSDNISGHLSDKISIDPKIYADNRRATINYIKIRSMDTVLLQSRVQKYSSGEISRELYSWV